MIMPGELPKATADGEKTKIPKMLTLGPETTDMKMIAGTQVPEDRILPEGWRMIGEIKVLEMDTLLGGCIMTGEVQETTESTGTLQEGKDMDKNQLPDGFMREKEIEVAVEEMKEADLEQDFLPEGWSTQESMK